MGVFKRNDNWWIDYYANGKRRREQIGTSKALAETVLKKRKVEIAEDKFLDRKEKMKVLFKDFSAEYLKIHSKPNNKAWKGFDTCNINVLNKYFPNKHLHEITTLDVQKFKVKRAEDVSDATVNRNLACLRSMFNRAIEWGKFNGQNPVKGVKMFKENNKRLRYLEKEELAHLLQNSDDGLKPILVVALNTGMRRGEILNLKWRDIDFKNDVIHLYETKNGEQRHVPMNQQMKNAIINVRKHPKSPYVFTYANGEQMRDVRKRFFTALAKSGINNFRFHDLRHTFASHLVMSGIDLNTVRELLGHKSLTMTLRYAHLSPNHKKKAVDVLSSQMEGIMEAMDTNMVTNLQDKAHAKNIVSLTV